MGRASVLDLIADCRLAIFASRGKVKAVAGVPRQLAEQRGGSGGIPRGGVPQATTLTRVKSENQRLAVSTNHPTAGSIREAGQNGHNPRPLRGGGYVQKEVEPNGELRSEKAKKFDSSI
jgi:hypothetical protein